MFVARNKNGRLLLFNEKPYRNSLRNGTFWDIEPFKAFPLDDDLFPDLKWEDEPIVVEIKKKAEMKNVVKKEDVMIGDAVIAFQKDENGHLFSNLSKVVSTGDTTSCDKFGITSKQIIGERDDSYDVLFHEKIELTYQFLVANGFTIAEIKDSVYGKLDYYYKTTGEGTVGLKKKTAETHYDCVGNKIHEKPFWILEIEGEKGKFVRTANKLYLHNFRHYLLDCGMTYLGNNLVL